MAAACAACFRPGQPRLPEVISECETNTARVCGTWRLGAGRTYSARWSQASVAKIRVLRFDDDSVAFERDDPAGSSAGMNAVYRGARTGGRSAAGVVTWTYRGRRFSGAWDAEW